MTTYALVKEGCGTHFVYDTSELERHVKMGWSVRPADWKKAQLEADKGRRAAAIAAELERLKAEQAEMGDVEDETPVEAPRRGRPAKAK